MTTNTASDGSTGQILVSHYLVERGTQFKALVAINSKRKRELAVLHNNNTLKRPIGKVHHRTRSHKSYKIPRKIKSKKRKAASSSSKIDVNRCRKHRRRNQTIATNTYLKPNQQLLQPTLSPPQKLPGHVWFAKRMKMDRDYYGFQIPLHDNRRGIKSLEKNIPQKPLIYNYSYYQPIKVTISHASFLQLLADYSDPDSDLTLQFSKFAYKENYMKEFDLLFYEKDCFPEKLIGPVTLTVLSSPSSKQLQVLFWVHPSIRATILRILQGSSQSDEKTATEDSLPLARLWLSGANINSILQQIIMTASSAQHHSDKVNVSEELTAFLFHALQDERRLKNVWKSGQVIATTIKDPRITTNTSSIDPPAAPKSFHWPKEDQKSLVWSSSFLQQRTKKDCLSNTIVQKLKSNEKFKAWNQLTKLAQQTFSFDPKSKPKGNQSKIVLTTTLNNPVNLPQQPSNTLENTLPPIQLLISRKSAPLAASEALKEEWIVILPLCDASSFHRLVTERHHAIPLGLHEMQTIQRLQQRFVFPNDYPDTAAGIEYWKKFYRDEQMKEEEKKPKAKRWLQLEQRNPYTILTQLIQEQPLQEREIVEENDETGEEEEEEENEEAKTEEITKDHEAMQIDSTSKEEKNIENTENLSLIDQSDDHNNGNDISSSIHYNELFLIVRDRKYFNDVIPPKYTTNNNNTTTTSSSSGILHCLRHSDWQYKHFFPRDDDRNEFITPLPPTPKPVFVFVKIAPCSRGLPQTGALLFRPTVSDLRHFIEHKVHSKLRKLLKRQQRQQATNDNSDYHPQFYSSSSTAIPSVSFDNKKKKDKSKKLSQAMSEETLLKKLRSASFDAVTEFIQYNPKLSNEWRGVNALLEEYEENPNQNEEIENESEERVLLGIVTSGFASHTNSNAFNHESGAIAMVHIERLHAMMAEYYGRYSYPLSHLMILFQNSRSNYLRPSLYTFL